MDRTPSTAASNVDSRTISASEAYVNVLSAPNSRWEHTLTRFGAAPLTLTGASKFQLTLTDRFFCIGSCFARNIEEALICRGVDVLSKRIVAPTPEAPNRVNGIVNKFTTASMLNEVAWALGEGDGVASIIETDRGCIDLQLAPGQPPVSHQRALERRSYIERNYFARIREADVFILTLGLTEAWRDEHTGVWQNMAPPYFAAKREPDRFTLKATSVEANVSALESIRAHIARVRPSARFIVTVSPVPMRATFTGVDVFVANMRSKSVLRAAADAFSETHLDVDYFPSYEMVIGASDTAFGLDRIHVRDAVVQAVIAQFCERYLPDLQAPQSRFIEALYLLANPDVDRAVRAGELGSGFEHWRARGQAEQRPLRPNAIPDWIYQAGVLDPPTP